MKSWWCAVMAAVVAAGAAAAPEQARLYGARGLQFQGTAVAAMQDGGSVAGGWQSIQRLGMLAIRFDAAGAPQWQRVIEVAGQQVVVRQVVEVGQGGVALLGEIGPEAPQRMPDLLLVKLEADGTPAWTRRFSAGLGTSLFPTDLSAGADGALVLLARLNGTGQLPTPSWLARVGADGTLQWQRRLAMEAASAQTLADGGVLVAGTSACPGGDDCAAWLVRLDAAAHPVQDLQIRIDGLYTYTGSARPAPGGGWYLAGGTVVGPGRNDAWLLHLDAGLAPVWARRWSGSGCGGSASAFAAVPAGDGILMTAGCGGGGDAYLARLDAQGLLQWQASPDYADLDPVLHVWRAAPTPQGGYFGVGTVADIDLPVRLLHLRSGADGTVPRCNAIRNRPPALTDGTAPAVAFRAAALGLAGDAVVVDAPVPQLRSPRLQAANACRL